MIVVNKIMHISEFLEKSRDPKYSKLEVKVHSNKTLKNPEVVHCRMYLNLYPANLHVGVETTIKGGFEKISKDENLPKIVKEIAGGFLAYFNTGIMTWIPIGVWYRMITFETVNELNIGIPKKIKEFVKEYYTIEIKQI